MNINELQITQDPQAIGEFVTNSWRPAGWVKVNGQWMPADWNKKPIANALLNREEWEALDAAIIARAKQKLNAWGDLIAAGLTSPGSLAEWYTKWRVASEMTAADVTMDFETNVDEDRTERKTYGQPVPLISKMFSIGRRELLTARATGTALEDNEAMAATDAVTEMMEKMLIDGDTSIVIGGSAIYGYRTLSARYTASAAGDFGTLSNVYGTFTSLLSALAGYRYWGPFNVYMARAQYFEMLDYYSDGTGQRGIDRVQALPQINKVDYNDLMTAGQFCVAQMTKDVVDIRQAMPLQVMRYDHPSGNRAYFVVVAAGVPRLKTDYAGYAGIAHISSA